MNLIRCVSAILLAVVLAVAVTTENDYDYPDYLDHPCTRDCADNESPKICKYHWILENYIVLSKACFDCPFNQSHCFLPHCVPVNGVSRDIRTINRKLPGPGVHVCEGDTVEVIVDNRMQLEEGTSIHWHGILQEGSQHMDGVNHITQCAIDAHTKFTYRFKAKDYGTHFYHSHAGVQRGDGLFGPLIVRRSPSLEPHFNLYDHDLTEHVIIISNWQSSTTLGSFLNVYHGVPGSEANLLLVNGLGSYREFRGLSNVPVFTPRATFTVTPGQRYRFRVISSVANTCPIQVSVDGHNLTMIASDGSPFQPFEVESFGIFNGERYDFILRADNISPLRNFWIRFRGLSNCGRRFASETAILKYQGADDVLPPETTTWLDGDRAGTILNPWNHRESGVNVGITSMRSLNPDDDVLTSTPDRKFYLSMDFGHVDNPKYNNPRYYSLKTPGMYQLSAARINNITFHLPASPLLSQYKDTPQSAYCNDQTVKAGCDTQFCSCIHRYQVEVGDLVELVLSDSGRLSKDGHTLHLHGYKFRVVGLEMVNKSFSQAEIIAMDARGELTRLTTEAPLKDSLNVPSPGYAIIRFRADNPGIWLLHCHIEFHVETGMALVFQTGNKSQLPTIPKNFPTCGDWKPED